MTWDMRYRFDQIAINSKVKKKPVEEDKHHYIGLEHLDSGNLVVSRWGTDVAPKGEKLLMKKGDVLFGKRRAYQKKVAIAPFDGIFSAHGMVLRPNEEIVDKAFFPMFISSDYFLDTAIGLSVGSLSPTINWKDLARQEFELPSMDKQRELAQVLWAMEETKVGYQQLLADTEELVKSRFVEMFGDPVTNPMKWPTKRFKDICTVGSSKRVYQSEQTSAGVPFLRVSDLISKIASNTETCDLYISEQQFNEFKQQGLVPNAGDILVTARGTLGQCYIIKPEDKFYFQDGMISWVHTSEAEINPVYVSYLFDSQSIRQQIDRVVSGTTVAYLSIAQLSNFDILLPAIELQNQFADFVAITDKSKFVLQYSMDGLL